MKPPRVLLAKPGLDGHDRGIKVIAMALRDAGADVIYLGLRRSVPEILQAAVDEDVDVIGISVLSGAHGPLVADLLDGSATRGIDIPIVVGGTIPAEDADALRALGIAAVFPVGSSLSDVVDGVLAVGLREQVRP
jgi:methylmalonyl-CoA mutase C-terminal domain/subunit